MSSLTASEIARFRDKALGSVPAKYRQPDVDDYGGRTVKDDSLEIVDYVPQTHVRIWYNCQMEGYELHHHAALEIIYCVQNTYTVTAGRETFSLGEGDILFIPPNVIHRLIGGVQGVRFIMLFDLEPASMFRETRLLAPVMNGPFHLRKKDRPDLYCAVQERFERMIDLYFSQQAMWEISVYTELLNIAAAIGRDYFDKTNSFSPSSSEHGKINYDKFSALLDYIDEHYSEDISLMDAASYVGFSKFHFTRLFHEYTGTTFYDYLLRRRIRAAQKMLSTDLSVTEISYRCGFHNLTSFSRSFRSFTGISPSAYRNYAERYHGKFSDRIILPEE